MNKFQNKEPQYLEALSSYLLLSEQQQCETKIINELNEKLNETLRKIYDKLIAETFEKQDCQSITEQLDKLIYLTAALSERPENRNENELTEIKEKLWLLLESLEAYCLETFKLSIW